MPRIEPDPAFPPRRQRRSWGGARRGAGAPRGNLNALKHGRYSNQMTALTHRSPLDSELRRLLKTLARPAARHGLAREQSRTCGLFESTKG